MRTVSAPIFRKAPASLAQMNIGGCEVHAYFGSLDTLGPCFPLRNSVLSDEERKAANRYHHPIDRQSYLVRHAVLRILISRYLPPPPHQIQFATNPYGKPFILNNDRAHPLEFNISFSNKMLLCAFSRGRRIGVDIEFMRPLDDMQELVGICFSDSEKAQFNSLSATECIEAFYTGWTQKEAFVKALGEGLSRNPSQFDVSLTPGAAELKSTAWDRHEAARWVLKTITPAPGYSASLAVEGNGWSLVSFKLTPETCTP